MTTKFEWNGHILEIDYCPHPEEKSDMTNIELSISYTMEGFINPDWDVLSVLPDNTIMAQQEFMTKKLAKKDSGVWSRLFIEKIIKVLMLELM